MSGYHSERKLSIKETMEDSLYESDMELEDQNVDESRTKSSIKKKLDNSSLDLILLLYKILYYCLKKSLINEEYKISLFSGGLVT